MGERPRGRCATRGVERLEDVLEPERGVQVIASFAAENGLATIIGTKTAGNVLGAVNQKVGAGYWLRVPVFGWYTSNGKCLEGQGVSPDLDADVDSPALDAAIDQQARRAADILNAA